MWHTHIWDQLVEDLSLSVGIVLNQFVLARRSQGARLSIKEI